MRVRKNPTKKTIPNNIDVGLLVNAAINYLRNMSQTLSNEQLINIANEYGTPVYVYHAEKITEQYQTLLEAFQKTNTRFFYASKALTNINILKHIQSLGCHIDCSSVNEVKLALQAGFISENILYTSNGIAFSEIEKSVSE